MGAGGGVLKNSSQASTSTSARYAAKFDDIDGTMKDAMSVGPRKQHLVAVVQAPKPMRQHGADTTSDFVDAADELPDGDDLDDDEEEGQERAEYRREDCFTCEFAACSCRPVRDPQHGGPGAWVRWREDPDIDLSKLDEGN
eukprot:TRINITY_DN10594_c0_g2_i1.p2 TRINITY_DN10594_c0_g2~~TRINITY_DN10594_c0_g2_i1.p2  ORF type:complete len:141 (-),score=37.37 TRINITY_DN10594_c0_g2_i1:53-475(-)